VRCETASLPLLRALVIGCLALAAPACDGDGGDDGPGTPGGDAALGGSVGGSVGGSTGGATGGSTGGATGGVAPDAGPGGSTGGVAPDAGQGGSTGGVIPDAGQGGAIPDAGQGGVTPDAGQGGAIDPCAGIELPPCPLPCLGIEPGGVCGDEGATCGNAIGDGCTCTGGQWQCTVHPPLGDGCNLVCRPESENPAPVCATACDCPSGELCHNGTCRVGVAPVYCCAGECPEGATCALPDGEYQTCRAPGVCVTTSDCFGHPAPIRCVGAWDCDPTHGRPADAPGDDGCNYTCVFNLLTCEPGQVCPFGDECLPCPAGGGGCEGPLVCIDPDYAAE
jgi:hypothetical protein